MMLLLQIFYEMKKILAYLENRYASHSEIQSVELTPFLLHEKILPDPISTLSKTAHIAQSLYMICVDWFDYQVQASLAPPTADPHGYWSDCKSDHARCNSSQIQFFQGDSSVAFWFALVSDL